MPSPLGHDSSHTTTSRVVARIHTSHGPRPICARARRPLRADDHVTLGARRRATAELGARDDGVCDDDVDDDDDGRGRGPREEGFHAAARNDDDETRRARGDARGGGRGGG